MGLLPLDVQAYSTSDAAETLALGRQLLISETLLAANLVPISARETQIFCLFSSFRIRFRATRLRA